MQKKIQTVVSLRELAAFAGLSVSHFSAVFRERTGYSPIEYFNHLKIQKACQYLAFTGMTVKELADLADLELVTGAVRDMQAIARTLLQLDKREERLSQSN